MNEKDLDWSVIDPLAKKVWDYADMGQAPQKADAIIVFGNYNPVVAHRAAELYAAGYAPVNVFTGGRSDSTQSWEKTEAETFADIAVARGVPKESILLETKATNSGENVRFARELLEGVGYRPKRVIAIQKPYAQRRMYAALRKQWPEVEVIAASPNLSYDEYMESSPKGKLHSISVMLGDLARTKHYAERGFTIPMDIPGDVWSAYEALVEMGLSHAVID